MPRAQLGPSKDGLTCARVQKLQWLIAKSLGFTQVVQCSLAVALREHPVKETSQVT